MKKVLFASVLSLLAACGQDNQSALKTSIAPGGQLPEVLRDSYVFSKDARPVDGNYQELSIVKASSGKYTAKLKTISSGFGAPVETKESVLANGLTCKSSEEPMLGLLSLTCSVDMRPVDGNLVEIKAIHAAQGLGFDVTLHTATSGFSVGGASEKTRTIANNMELAAAVKAEKSWSYSVDARPVDGNLVELNIANGSVTLKTTTAGFGFPVETSEEVIAEGLDCKANANGLICRKDARPVDGNLVEVIVTKVDGKFEASLHVVTAGFGAPVSDTTTVIASGLSKN